MKAKSIKGNSVEQITTALFNCIAYGFQPTLAIVFLSIKQDDVSVTELFDKKSISGFGTTTAGKFLDRDIGQGLIAIKMASLGELTGGLAHKI